LEWNRWVEVERLAADPPRLAALAVAFLQDGEREMPWPKVVQQSLVEPGDPSSV
jgi:hypothetical protein